MNNDLKNWLIAATGTVGSFGLAQLNLILSSLVALATLTFTVLKIIQLCRNWNGKREE